MSVSPEELAQRDGLVVCPQCLTAYQAVPPGSLPQAASLSTKHTAGTDAPKRFCPHCGKRIDEGINFCPYCGNKLQHMPPPIPTPESSGQELFANKHVEPAEPTHAVDSFEWKPLLPSYRYVDRHAHEPASKRFQAVAIAIILALLSLLAYIILQAIKL